MGFIVHALGAMLAEVKFHFVHGDYTYCAFVLFFFPPFRSPDI